LPKQCWGSRGADPKSRTPRKSRMPRGGCGGRKRRGRGRAAPSTWRAARGAHSARRGARTALRGRGQHPTAGGKQASEGCTSSAPRLAAGRVQRAPGAAAAAVTAASLARRRVGRVKSGQTFVEESRTVSRKETHFCDFLVLRLSEINREGAVEASFHSTQYRK